MTSRAAPRRTESDERLTSHQSRVAVTGPQKAWVAKKAFAVALRAMAARARSAGESEREERRETSEGAIPGITQAGSSGFGRLSSLVHRPPCYLPLAGATAERRATCHREHIRPTEDAACPASRDEFDDP